MVRYAITLVLLIISQNESLAHGSHGNGIVAGFTHPIFGIDHAVVILGTGFLAYLVNRAKWYVIFLPFLLAMIAGGFMGVNHEATYLIEKIIAASIVFVGLYILMNEKLNQILIMLSLTIFGFFHGYAHGAEMPQDNNLLVYVTGYSLGAHLVAGLGMFICRAISHRSNYSHLTYLASGIILGAGIIICLN